MRKKQIDPNPEITIILVEKGIDDIKKLILEAKQRNLEGALARWLTYYMSGLQKTNKFAHDKVSDLLEENFNEWSK